MVFRLLPFAIVAFWLAMMAMLIQVNVRPDDSQLLRVPVEHVMKVVFLHGLNSDLNILEYNKRIGNLSLRPRELRAGEPRRFDFSGNLLLGTGAMPLATRQSFRWDGWVQVNKALELEELTLHVEVRKPGVNLAVQVGRDRVLHYEVKQSGFAPQTGTLPLDAELPATLLEPLGIGPEQLRLLPGGMNVPTVAAQQNRIHLRNEGIEVYEMTVRQGDLEVASLAVSQLGQVLLARTIFGYTLQAEDISP